MKLEIKRLSTRATLPTRANPDDAGLDLYALETVFIPKGATVKVATGVAIGVPAGMVGKIEDRSSMAARGLRTGGGVVDSGYTGDVTVVLHNLSNDYHPHGGQRGYTVHAGEKIAQMLLYRVETPAIQEVTLLGESTRGDHGFGSSGI